MSAAESGIRAFSAVYSIGEQLTPVLRHIRSRQIFTDGRKLPEGFDLPAFLGYSVGRREGDTFVVKTAGFNDRTALDGMGHPHSDALHLTERFRRRDFGRKMTFDDPKTYTKPFTIKVPHDLVPDNDIYELFCENEKDAVHMPKPQGRP